MKKRAFLLISILTLLHLTLLNYFKIFNVKPDFFLIALIVTGLSFGFKQAFALSLFLGAAKDILGTATFGINTLVFPLWIILIIAILRKIPLENIFARTFLVLAAAIINAVIYRMVSLSSGVFMSAGIFLRVLFLECFYTAGVSFFIFKVLR